MARSAASVATATKPSRTIRWPVTRGLVPPAFPLKMPADDLDYTFDFQDLLADGGLTLISAAPSVSQGLLVTDPVYTPSINPTEVTVVLLGGTPNTTATIRLLLTLNNGQMYDALASIPIGSGPPSNVTSVPLDSNIPAGGYTYNQQTASAVWVIPHGLNRYPTVITMDSTGDEVEGDVHYDSLDQVTVTFSSALTGSAYLA